MDNSRPNLPERENEPKPDEQPIDFPETEPEPQEQEVKPP